MAGSRWLEYDRERLRELESAFTRRFLPPEARSGHRVLFDFDREVDHAPDAAELEEALAAYLQLVEEAFRYGPQGVRSCLGSSELMLGLLGRALGAEVKPRASATAARLIRLVHEVLEEAEAEHSWARSQDGFKRIDVLARALEEHAQA